MNNSIITPWLLCVIKGIRQIIQDAAPALPDKVLVAVALSVRASSFEKEYILQRILRLERREKREVLELTCLPSYHWVSSVQFAQNYPLYCYDIPQHEVIHTLVSGAPGLADRRPFSNNSPTIRYQHPREYRQGRSLVKGMQSRVFISHPLFVQG